MALPHAKPIEPISVRPLGDQFTTAQTTTLVKTDALEVIRLVLPAGKQIAGHDVPGEITLQCLEGKITFRAKNSECELTSGELIYVGGSEEHSLQAEANSSVLLTILLDHKSS